MMQILIFSGTTEGRMLSELLAAAQIEHTVSVATDYGEQVMQKDSHVLIKKGRMSKVEIYEYLKEHQIGIVVDATHPYAVEVSETIATCIAMLEKEGNQIQAFRLMRDTGFLEQSEKVRLFPNHESCAKALCQISGNILLTSGSKSLATYCETEELKNRLFVRVIPSMESIENCQKLGILTGRILAMQGPFSTRLNIALIQQYQISCLVTKQGGMNGGFPEKMLAAEQAGIPLFVVQKERREAVSNMQKLSFQEVVQKLEEMTGISLMNQNQAKLEMTLAGIGMGNADSMTGEVRHAVENADLIVGAERVIAPYIPALEKCALYKPLEILAWLVKKSMQYAEYRSLKVAILFSGDSGFYSGCRKVHECLLNAIAQKQITGKIQILAGISSVQAMAAACRVSWQDAGIFSIHGQTQSDDWEEKLLFILQSQKTLFLLVSGAADIRTLGRILPDGIRILVGYQLSYPEEEILELTKEECLSYQKDGLIIVVLQRKEGGNVITPYLEDGAFVRGHAPMTKAEVRQVSICHLHLRKDSIVYDIGSGTGSVALEIAGLSSQIHVYAIEEKEEALLLMEQNRKQQKAYQMQIVKGAAPDALDGLACATHAFIGGSGGRLFSILQKLYEINPKMRIVINAVSLETISQIEKIKEQFCVTKWELIQMQVTRYRQIGSYQMPNGENPIMICSFSFGGEL